MSATQKPWNPAMPSGYTRIQRSLVLTACLVSAYGFLAAAAAYAHETWQSIKSDAEMFSYKRNFRAAANGFERALALCPPARQNDRVDIQLALATVYNNLQEIDKAIGVLNDAGATLKQLKAKDSLDPQVLVSLKTLIETCDKGYDTKIPYDQRIKFKMRMTDAVNKICADVYPRGLSSKRKLEFARTFVANGDLPGCLRNLHEIHAAMKKSDAKDPLFSQCEWAMAAVQQRMGKPQMMETLANRQRKNCSEAHVLSEIANANLWAADYETGKQNLDKALGLLKRKPNREDGELVLSVYIDICRELGDYKTAERWQRKRLALFSPDEPKYKIYQRGLAHNLRHQNRFADADKLSPRKGHHRSGALTEWEWFLTDKEKEDLARADAQGRGRNFSKPAGQPRSTSDRP